jgi:hypothetical protein
LRLAARAACALLAVWLSGCALMRGPSDFQPVAGEDELLRARVESLASEASARRGLRAVGKLRVAGRNGSGSVREVVLAERPARLRLESLNLLGQASSLLVTDGERFAFFDGKRLDHGAVTPRVLSERLGLELAPEEAVRALLVEPAPEAWRPSEIVGRGAEREVRLATQSLRFGAAGELAAMRAFDPAGRVRWQAEYGDWSEVPGGRYPFRVVLSCPGTELRAELELSQVELNPELDPSLFRVRETAAP